MAGAAAERQEAGLIRHINSAVSKNKKNPITIIAGKQMIEGVIKAEKYKGRQAGGSEPYTDVVLHVQNGKKTEQINLSLKGESAPSLAGGGLKGLELAIPGLARRYMSAVDNHLKSKMKLKKGDKVPDVYGKINESVKRKIVVGNENMGGPIDYMYIGRMDVQAKYDEKSNRLVLHGNLIPAEEYAKTHDLYFRLRARREDQRYDPSAKDNSGAPKVYGKSPSRGDSAGRIVVTDNTPSSAIIISFG